MGIAAPRWRGDPARVAEGQAVFFQRAHLMSAACDGRYTHDMERSIT